MSVQRQFDTRNGRLEPISESTKSRGPERAIALTAAVTIAVAVLVMRHHPNVEAAAPAAIPSLPVLMAKGASIVALILGAHFAILIHRGPRRMLGVLAVGAMIAGCVGVAIDLGP